MGILLFGGSSCISLDRALTDGTTVEWIKAKDPKTGYEVWQLTTDDSMSEAFYFYAQSFTSDDRYVIFRSKRSGVRDAYRCDLTNGRITQLTFDEDIGRAPTRGDVGYSVEFLHHTALLLTTDLRGQEQDNQMLGFEEEFQHAVGYSFPNRKEV